VDQFSGSRSVGHKIVCETAFHELNDKAREEVGKLIATDDEFTAFSDSCIWPDHPKRRRVEHFVNVARDVKKIDSNACPQGENKCLLSAIANDVGVLSGGADADKKLESLKYLGHWIGDLHQPLHVSFEDDQGSNKIKESGPCSSNLHSVWDGCIITQTLGTDVRAIGSMLQEEITNAQRNKWKGPVEKAHEWATESLVITRRANVGYCVSDDATCKYSATQAEFDEDKPEKITKVDKQYIQDHAAVVRQRLKQAGVRLAELLNQALGQ
jgi:S1/P1 Nuclease